LLWQKKANFVLVSGGAGNHWLRKSLTAISFTNDRTPSCMPDLVFFPLTRLTFDPVTGLMCRITLKTQSTYGVKISCLSAITIS